MLARRALWVSVPLLALTACAAHRTAAWELATPAPGAVGETVIERLIADGDEAFAMRPERLADALAAYKAALRYRPEDVSVLVRLSRTAIQLGVAGSGSQADQLLDDAVTYAERALATRNPDLRRHAQRKARPAVMFDVVTHEDLPALITYAEALLAFADRHGTPTLLEQQDRIRAATRRAIAIDRRAAHAAPDRLLATLEASLPASEGANLSVAVDHFEAAIAEAPGFLPTRLVYAERYALRIRDARLYRRLLGDVIAADPHALPDVVAENLAAQKAARHLLRPLSL